VSAELAVIAGGGEELAELPDLSLAVSQVQGCIDAQDREALTDAKRRAEAQALYEKRKGYEDRELHFGRLRMVCEAGIAVIALDTRDRVDAPPQDWTLLAAAFERGKLLDELANYNPSKYTGYKYFARTMTYRGYYWAPGKVFGLKQSVPWWKARILAREAGIPLESIPLDPDEVNRRSSRSVSAQATRRKREMAQQQALRRIEEIDRQRLIAAAAKDRNASLGAGYAFLRKSLQAFQDARHDLGGDERRQLDDAFRFLYMAEDSIGGLLKLGKVAA
jgi:hypothetical protein